MLFLHLPHYSFPYFGQNLTYILTVTDWVCTLQIEMVFLNLCSPMAASSFRRPLVSVGVDAKPIGVGSLRTRARRVVVCLASSDDVSPNRGSLSGDSTERDFCIIEGPETVQDFAPMQLQEIQDSIRSRRNKIFLLMEEVRRLRVQERIKSMKGTEESLRDEDDQMLDIPSSIPFLPNMTHKTLRHIYLTSFAVISGVILFGGLIAPTLELKLGLGGTSYAEFISQLHLPKQLSQVDPIVASFSGGAVGVISALMLLELNNVKQQEEKKCKYCHGTGYLACARCSASGLVLPTKPIVTSATDCPLNAPTMERCPNCSGAGKVMCPTCLCTGMAMASEHDHRIDPFDY